jgi:hypothetical protein
VGSGLYPPALRTAARASAAPSDSRRRLGARLNVASIVISWGVFGVRSVAQGTRQGTRRARTAPRQRSNDRSEPPQNQSADPRFAWYVELALMALLDVIWPVALVIGVGHEIAHRARSQALRELAEGVEAAG